MVSLHFNICFIIFIIFLHSEHNVLIMLLNLNKNNVFFNHYAILQSLCIDIFSNITIIVDYVPDTIK